MRTIRILTFVLLFLILAPIVQAAGPYREAALGALSWIASQQQADGSFPGFGPGSTADAVFAICAVGGDPNGFLQGENSPITFLAAQSKELSKNAGSTAKAILAVLCAGKDPRRFGGVDLVAALEKAYDAHNGVYGTDLTGHAFALLALSAAGRPIPAAAVDYVRRTQTPEGGWAWDGNPASGGADTNSTALAVQALLASGVSASDPAIQAALAYFHTQQNADGGFPYAKPSPWGSESDTNSTAYVVQALCAAGEDPEGPAWTVEGHTPLSFLLQMQLPGGAFQWQAQVPGENALATYQVVPALMLRPFPLARMAVGQATLLPETGRNVFGLGYLSTILLGAGLCGLGLALRRRTG